MTGSSPTRLRPAAARPRPSQFGLPALPLRARGPPPCSGAGPGQPPALAPAPSSGRSRRRRRRRRVHSWSPLPPPYGDQLVPPYSLPLPLSQSHTGRVVRGKQKPRKRPQRDQEVIVTEASGRANQGSDETWPVRRAGQTVTLALVLRVAWPVLTPPWRNKEIVPHSRRG